MANRFSLRRSEDEQMVKMWTPYHVTITADYPFSRLHAGSFFFIFFSAEGLSYIPAAFIAMAIHAAQESSPITSAPTGSTMLKRLAFSTTSPVSRS